MIVFPALDIKDGKAVRLRQGKKSQVDVFSDHPLDMALRWQQTGARWLHVIDLDGAFDGASINMGLIAEIVARLKMPVQVGGGIRSLESARKYLDAGVQRLIIGTVALENPGLYQQMLRSFPGRVGISIDAANGQVKTRGWVKDSGRSVMDVLPQISGSAFIIYTDIERDGMRSGVNLDALRDLLNHAAMPVIAAGGVASMADIQALRALEHNGNLEGVITGRAIYEGSLDPGAAQKWLDCH